MYDYARGRTRSASVSNAYTGNPYSDTIKGNDA